MNRTGDSVSNSKKDTLERIHIVLLISSLSAGGAERIMSMMANYWIQQGRRITLVTLDSSDKDFYKLDAGIHRVALSLLGRSSGLLDALSSNYKRLVSVRRTIISLKPDVIISFMDRTNVLCLIACYGSRIPVIVSERTDPRKHDTGKLWSLLREQVYPLAASLVVQTRGVAIWMREKFKGIRIDVIPNPVMSICNNEQSKVANLPANTVVSVGRLSQEKGFDVLIEAFSKSTNKYPDWNLVIFGEGPERKNLEALVSRLGVEGKVSLPGRIENPEKVVGTAEIFAMSSRYEGFPNALLEAMTCGLPVVATDCQSGPREILNGGEDGLLVPVEDSGAMADSLISLMGDPDARKRLGENARASVQRFSLPNIMNQWEDLFQQVIVK